MQGRFRTFVAPPIRIHACIRTFSGRTRSLLNARNYATEHRQDGPAITATNRAEVTLKRFWKKVAVEAKDEGLFVTLDTRPIKTPSGNLLVLPHSKRLLATLIANEWENQDKILKNHALPLTSLATRVIDGMSDSSVQGEVRVALLKYLDTDTICFHEAEPEVLVALQNMHWNPIINWVKSEFNVEIKTFNSLLGTVQPAETKLKIGSILRKLDPWQLASMERSTYTTKSFLISLALIHNRISPEEAAQAAHVEVNSQIERWGEVEDSHDVDFHDIRRQLSSVSCVLCDS